MERTELIGIEPIMDLVELTLWTAYVKYERTVSLLILAKPESGKTELLKKYRKNNGTISRRRFTAFGIIRDLKEGRIAVLFDRPKILGHILIYDLRMLWGYKHNTVDSNMDFLDAITEEGLQPESSYAINPDDLKGYEGLKGGIIAGINPHGFFTSSGKRTIKRNLLKGGFFSRNVIASYNITGNLLQKIFNSIVEGKYRRNKDFVNLIAIDFPSKRIKVRISTKHMTELKDITEDVLAELQEDLAEEYKGIRLLKSLVALAKASALREGETKVESEDIERIQFLSNWMNTKMRNLKSEYPFYKNGGFP
jgi:hypothetical protein